MASIIKSDNGVSSGITGIVQSADSSGQLVLQTTTSGGTATTAVTIDNTQKVTFANTVGFGSNAGITFNNSSALTNSTLNDYETGTWTPVDGSGSGLTFTSNYGFYTKIGNTVICSGSCVYPSTANGNTASIGGLPFTSSSNANTAYSGGYLRYTTYSTFVTFTVSTTRTDSPLYFIGGGQPTNANVSTKRFDFVIIYTANF